MRTDSRPTSEGPASPSGGAAARRPRVPRPEKPRRKEGGKQLEEEGGMAVARMGSHTQSLTGFARGRG